MGKYVIYLATLIPDYVPEELTDFLELHQLLLLGLVRPSVHLLMLSPENIQYSMYTPKL
jgi:hypothetical protein